MIVVGFISNFKNASLACEPKKSSMPAAAVYQEIKKLQVLSKVLYVGAHPDDENNKLITHLTNNNHCDVAYLSLTRGEGGQNYIGSETDTDLGVLREQELLAARRIDGGSQYFTSAKDFGFSKYTEQTANTWGEEAILADIVWVIRHFQPDIIINRFPDYIEDKHAHHTVSAQLTKKAFEFAADENYFPEQLQQVKTWAAKRLVWNVYAESGVKDIGGYVAYKPIYSSLTLAANTSILDKSIAQIAAESRNQHRCQALQAKAERKDTIEYFEHVAGSPAKQDIFEGITTDWSRLIGPDHCEADSSIQKSIYTITRLLETLATNIHVASNKLVASNMHVANDIIPMLVAVLREIRTLKSSTWKQRKEEAIQQLLVNLLAVEITATANKEILIPTEEVQIAFQLHNPSSIDIQLKEISSSQIDTIALKHAAALATDNFLLPATHISLSAASKVLEEVPFSLPSWLVAHENKGRYILANPAHACLSNNQAAGSITATLTILGQELVIKTPLRYRYATIAGEEKVVGHGVAENSVAENRKAKKDATAKDPSTEQPINFGPPVVLTFAKEQQLVQQEHFQEITLSVKALSDAQHGEVSLALPADWQVSPLSSPLSLHKAGQEQQVTFQVFIPKGAELVSNIGASVQIDGKRYNRTLKKVAYKHITTQIYFPIASLRITSTSLKTKAKKIAYIKGTQDAMDQSLAQLVHQVDSFDPLAITFDKLKTYDAVVLGKRIYNIGVQFANYHTMLQAYVQQGGLVIAQYNTNYDLMEEQVGIYPLALTGNRISDEQSAVEFLEPTSEILNYPNKITADDFKGWKQERALFIPAKWDASFTPILRSRDFEEESQDGSLLVRAAGKGYYVYSSLSFHRQLPAGVPGAYRLFANLLSLGKKQLT